MSNTARAEQIAVEYGRHAASGEWGNAYLVACGCEVKKPGSRSLVNTDDKLSIKEFAKLSRQDTTIIASTLRAWDAAAADNFVPWSSDGLTPTDAEAWVDFTADHTNDAWLEYFDVEIASRREGWRQSSAKRKPSKEQVVEAIKTDPEIEKAARGATIAKEIERSTAAKAKGRKIVDPIAPRDDNTISQREIDEADAQFDSLIVKLRAMRKTGQEALSLALDIHGFDQNAKRALVTESVDGLRTLLDAIAEAADGRSMDDELQSLLSEGN